MPGVWMQQIVPSGLVYEKGREVLPRVLFDDHCQKSRPMTSEGLRKVTTDDFRIMSVTELLC